MYNGHGIVDESEPSIGGLMSMADGDTLSAKTTNLRTSNIKMIEKEKVPERRLIFCMNSSSHLTK